MALLRASSQRLAICETRLTYSCVGSGVITTNSFVRLLHYFVQQSIGIALYAADVLRDGILPIELLNFHLRNINGAKLHKNNEINFVLRKIIIKTW